jgi:hypothetical protein
VGWLFAFYALRLFFSAHFPASIFTDLFVHLFFRDRDQRLHYLLESLERRMRTGLGVFCHAPSLDLFDRGLEPDARERRDPAVC